MALIPNMNLEQSFHHVITQLYFPMVAILKFKTVALYSQPKVFAILGQLIFTNVWHHIIVIILKFEYSFQMLATG